MIRKLIVSKYCQHKETTHNFFWRSLQVFGKQGVTFLIFFLCAMLLSPYEFGIYNYALTVIFFLIIFGDFGISTAISKFVTEYNISDKEKLKLVLFNSGIILIGLTIVVVILAFTFGPFYLGEKYVYVLYLLPLSFLVPMTSLYDGIYRGLNKFRSLAIISLTISIVIIPVIYLLVQSCGMVGALVAQNIFYLVMLIALALGHRNISFKINKEMLLNFFKYSFLIGLANLGIFLYTRIDILVLGYFGYINEIAFYEVANKIFMVLAIPFAIFSQIIAPRLTKINFEKKYDLIINKLKKYFIYSFVVGSMLSILFFFLIKPVVFLFFQQYNDPTFYLFFNILLIILPIRFFGTILTTGFLIPTNNAKILTYNNLLFGVVNLLMDILFVILFGPIGIIFSTLILGYISVIVALFLFTKNMNKKKGNC